MALQTICINEAFFPPVKRSNGKYLWEDMVLTADAIRSILMKDDAPTLAEGQCCRIRFSRRVADLIG